MPDEKYKLKTVEELCEERGVNEEFAQGLLEASCKTCGYPSAHTGDICAECTETQNRLARRIAAGGRRWRDFLHGPGAVHSHSHGWLDPHDRYDKRHLDP